MRRAVSYRRRNHKPQILGTASHTSISICELFVTPMYLFTLLAEATPQAKLSVMNGMTWVTRDVALSSGSSRRRWTQWQSPWRKDVKYGHLTTRSFFASLRSITLSRTKNKLMPYDLPYPVKLVVRFFVFRCIYFDFDLLPCVLFLSLSLSLSLSCYCGARALAAYNCNTSSV